MNISGKGSTIRRWLSTRELWLFLLLFFSYAYFFPRWADWNQNSRINLTLALIDQGSIAIDDYYHNTGDYAVFNGRIYTDKAPGLSFIGAIPYALYRAIMSLSWSELLLQRASHNAALNATLNPEGSGLLADKLYFAGALYFVTVLTISLPSALLGVALYRFLRRLLGDGILTVALVIAYGLGTVAFTYSSVFYGHQVGAVLLFICFYLLFRIRREELSDVYLWLVGVLVGLMVLVEFTSAIAAAFLGLYALFILRNKMAIYRIILGGLPFALILGWYNASAFGSPFASSYRYLGNFPEISNTGVLGFAGPRWDAFWGITFSPYRGLFFFSPFLLLALPGFWRLAGRHWPAYQAEFWLILSIVAGQFFLVSSWYDWRGGFAIGPRNLLLILPLLMVPVAIGAAWLAKRRAGAILVWGLLAVSVMIMSVASVSGQEFPPITVAHPLFEFLWPRFLAGDIARNLGMVLRLPAWYSLIPWLVIVGGAFLWMQFAQPSRSQSRV